MFFSSAAAQCVIENPCLHRAVMLQVADSGADSELKQSVEFRLKKGTSRVEKMARPRKRSTLSSIGIKEVEFLSFLFANR
jgi:hypothetical protein